MLIPFLEALWAEAGKPRREGDDDILGTLVRMMLGQATSKANAAAAFDELLARFGGDWRAVATAAVEDVAGAIAVGGLARQKAPRIQSLLRRAREEFGDYTLEPLRDRAPAEALEYLLDCDGVGPTTANYVLMDAAGMDLFPINGGIRRCLERVGVLDPSASPAAAHAALRPMLAPGDAYAAHVTLVRHARAVCTKRRPRCAVCAGREHCVAGRRRWSAQSD